VSSEAPAGEDTRIWVGRLTSGHDAEHAAFVQWLNGPEAHEIFRRRRLNEYRLTQAGDQLTVVLKAPHTGDPRIMIDFLRYPGLWPDYWEFERGGQHEDEAPTGGDVKVDWRRAEAA
jgi:hypothetical protein